ncbi:MAG: glycosyltransferase [Hydrogenibacillus sp.]|nr:glycosyltransferase [Hydrogenibacillus sp.]
MNRPAPLTVLIIAYWFPPLGGGGVPRAQKLVKYLPRYGIRPVVLTVSPPDYLPLDEGRFSDVPGHVPVYRVPHPRWHLALRSRLQSGRERGPKEADRAKEGGSSSASARALRNAAIALRSAFFIPEEEIVWYRGAVKAGLEAVRAHRVDLLFSTSGPVTDHLVARALQRRTHLPWVADFRDPWTQNMHFTTIPWRAALETAMERAVFRSATHITTVTEAFRRGFLALYPEAAIDVIYNGFDPEDVQYVRHLRESRPPDSDGVLTFAHTGILYEKRHPRAFFQALRALMDEGAIDARSLKLEFAGMFDPPGRDDNRRMIRTLGLETAFVDHGHLPYFEALSLLARATVLLIVGDLHPRAGDYIPGKLYDYMMVGRPIFALLRPGEAADIIRSLPHAYTAPPDDEALIRAELRRLIADWRRGAFPEALDVLGEAAFVRYRRDVQAEQFAELFHRLVKGDRPSGVYTASGVGDRKLQD